MFMSENFTSEKTHEFSNFQIFHLKALNGLIAFLKFNPFPLGPLNIIIRFLLHGLTCILCKDPKIDQSRFHIYSTFSFRCLKYRRIVN